MSSNRLRVFRPKAWTWLERDARPDQPHVTVDPQSGVVLRGGPDGEGRFMVVRELNGEKSEWVADRRHWTEIPPKPVD
jgi:hypothetical protein